MKIQDIEAMNSKTYITDGGDKRTSATTSELVLAGVAIVGVLAWVSSVNSKNNMIATGYLNNNLLSGRLQDQQFALLYGSNQGVTAINGMPHRGNAQIV